MGRLTWFLIGAVTFGCAASAAFPYRYYVLHADSYKGTLLGATPETDLDLATCQPAAGKQSPCLVMLKDAYLQLKADYLQLSTQLSDCQKGQ